MQVVRVKFCREENIGCSKSPNLILKELRKFKNIDMDKLNFEEIHVNLEDREESNFLIFENGKEIFEKNDLSFFIGGDDSINDSLFGAFAKVVDKGIVVVFDAHTGCESGGRIRNLIEKKGLLSGRRIILIGCRNYSNSEMNFIREAEINFIKMEVLKEDLEGVCDVIMERARNSGGVYLSLNLNAVDPAFAPGVCDFETCGMDSYEIQYIINRLKLLENFRGMGVFGVDPSKDLNGISINLAARLLAGVIGK